MMTEKEVEGADEGGLNPLGIYSKSISGIL